MKVKHFNLVLIGLIILFVGGFIAVSYKTGPKVEKKVITKTKTPPSQSFLKSEKEGIVKDVNILSSGITPQVLTIKTGDIVRVINSSEKDVKLKVSIFGGVIINIPAGKSSYLTNFTQNGRYEISDGSASGKIIVEE